MIFFNQNKLEKRHAFSLNTFDLHPVILEAPDKTTH